MFRTLGPTEIIIIIFVFVLLFGGKKIADIGKGLGEGIRNFKNSVKTEDDSKDDKKQVSNHAKTTNPAR
jgi:sec-independent protein translocase protein TatA